MKAMRTAPILPRTRLLALGLLATLALAACGKAENPHSALLDPDNCNSEAACESPARLSDAVRLDTDAILAGMQHARARLGLQEDATP